VTDAGQGPALAVRAPAKINLSLHVLGLRPDGYHGIRTVMQAVSLCDDLVFRPLPDGRIELTCSGADVPEGEGNLVVRAARLLQERAGVEAGARIALEKRIPVGAGLGGGSSDGAVTLLALSELWGLGLGVPELSRLAAELGSDVPFFLRGGTALCTGRGERVSPAECPSRMHYVLVTPALSVSTASVYGAQSGLTSAGDASNVLMALRSSDAELLGHCLANDLQDAALRLHGELDELWTKLKEAGEFCGVEGILLSGSGSSFFAVARGAQEAAQAAGSLQASLGVPCTAVHSLPAWDGRVSRLTTGRGLL